jgi:aryl-alcohol dehydrogenase-like predicted oxidoreductase
MIAVAADLPIVLFTLKRRNHFMETRSIGSLQVSVLGLGCNNFGWHIDQTATRAVVAAALDAGITHFDTADIYGGTLSEEFLGRSLGGRRDQVVIATKFGMKVDEDRQGAAPKYVRQAADDSLRRLGTDRIDLYYLHQPDPQTPIADTLAAMADLVHQGKVREIACSNFSPDQLRQAHAAARGGVRFVALQNEYSLLHREPEEGTLQACRELQMAFVPYFPLKSGLLTGKYRQGTTPTEGRLSGPKGSRFEKMGAALLTDENLETVERLIAFAESHSHSVLDLAFAWLLAQEPVVSVIAGATRPEQIHQNAKAVQWKLNRQDLQQLGAALR